MRLLEVKQGLGLTIFDIDDTLFHTTAQIKVIKNGQVVRSLTNQEFNNYELQPGEEYDFGEFRSAEKFNKESQPIRPMIAKLKAILNNAEDGRVIMLTARADFDDKEKFLSTFKKYGIDMSRVHVHRAGNLPGDENPAYKKAVWVRKYLNTGKYNRVRLYDDSKTNLTVFKALEKEYPNVKFEAYYVGPEGQATVHEADNIAHTFAGQDPRNFKSPNGGTPTMMIVTGQGSRYLMTSDGMVLRLKSFHANTGGEDQGLKDWSQHIEFYDPTDMPGGVTFPLAVSKAVEKRLPVTLSKTNDGRRALLIHKENNWQVAKISDVFKYVAQKDDYIVSKYSTTPKLNWNVMDYNMSNNVLSMVHPGSPVTHGVKLSENSVNEAEADTPYSNEIKRQLTAAGYKELGAGADAAVWAKDSSYVIKILMPEDSSSGAEETFRRFYEFCQEHHDLECLPKFNEVNTIDIQGKDYTQIDMERLIPLKSGSFNEGLVYLLSDYATKKMPWERVKQALSQPKIWHDTEYFSRSANQFALKISSLNKLNDAKLAVLYNVMTLLYHTGRINKMGWDLHTENAMQREDGTIVITDPWFNMETEQ